MPNKTHGQKANQCGGVAGCRKHKKILSVGEGVSRGSQSGSQSGSQPLMYANTIPNTCEREARTWKSL